MSENKNPKIEIKTVECACGHITEIYVDGKKIPGVRRFELTQKAGEPFPTLTIDINALDLSTDVKVFRLNHYGFEDSIKRIIFENDSYADAVDKVIMGE